MLLYCSTRLADEHCSLATLSLPQSFAAFTTPRLRLHRELHQNTTSTVHPSPHRHFPVTSRQFALGRFRDKATHLFGPPSPNLAASTAFAYAEAPAIFSRRPHRRPLPPCHHGAEHSSFSFLRPASAMHRHSRRPSRDVAASQAVAHWRLCAVSGRWSLDRFQPIGVAPWTTPWSKSTGFLLQWTESTVCLPLCCWRAGPACWRASPLNDVSDNPFLVRN